MKNILKKRSIIVALVLAVVAFCSAVFIPYGVKTSPVHAEEEEGGVSYSTSWCSLEYSDNKVVFLISPSVRDYKSISKSQIKELVNVLIQIGTDIVYDKFGGSLGKEEKAPEKSSKKQSFAVFSIPQIPGIDINLLKKVISDQLTNGAKEEVDLAINTDKYDDLVQYYTDKKVYKYLVENGFDETLQGEDYENKAKEVIFSVKEQMKETVSEVVKEIFEGDPEKETVAGQAVDKIEELLSSPDVKGNGESIKLPLSDITLYAYELPSVSEGSQNSLVDVVNDLKIIDNFTLKKSEKDKLVDDIKETVKTADTQEIKDFFSGTKDGDLLEIVKAVEFGAEDVKEMAKAIGGTALIEIMADLGEKAKELLDVCDVTSEDIKEIVNDPSFNVDIFALIKAVELIKINDNTVYQDKKVCVSGIVNLIKGLPTFATIAETPDENMRLNFNFYIKTSLGEGDIDVTIGFDGDCSKIRRVAKFIADHVSVYKENGVYNIKIIVPDELSKALKKICNTERIPEKFKDIIFNATGDTVAELYETFKEEATFDKIIEELRDINYEKIAENIMSAEQIKRIFGGFVNLSSLTDDKLDDLIDKFMDLAKKVKGKIEGTSYDEAIDLVKKYVGKVIGEAKVEELKNIGKLESLYERVVNLMKRVDDDKLNANYIREYINDGNVTYFVNRVLNKISSYEGYYDKFLSLVDKAYNKIPERFLDNTLLSLYEGDGLLELDGTLAFDLHDIIDRLYNVLDGRLPGSLDGLLDKFYSKADGAIDVLLSDSDFKLSLDLTAQFYGVNKITFMVDNEIVKEGLLPTGAKLSYFSPYEGYIWQLADNSVCEYMPNGDTVVYAQSNFSITVSEDVDITYDAMGKDISVSITTSDTLETFAYQWYKDGEIIDGATSDTYHVVNASDSGVYTCKVTSNKCYMISEEITVAIEKSELTVNLVSSDADDTIEFGDTAPTYSVSSYSGFLGDDDESVISGTKTVASACGENGVPGTYGIETPDSTIFDADNYSFKYVYNNLTVTKRTIGVSWGTRSFVYTGNELKPTATATNTVSGFECVLSVSTTGVKNVGTDYVATASIGTGSEYYALPDDTSVTQTTFDITKADYDMSGVKFEDSTVTYDGQQHTIVVNGTLPTGADGIQVKVSYSSYQEEIGEFVFVATFSSDSTNYNAPNPATKTATLKMNPKALTINVAMNGFTFGSAATTPSSTVEGLVGTDTVTVTYRYVGTTFGGETYDSATVPTKAGTYKVYAEINEKNYVIGNVNPATITIAQNEINLSAYSWNYVGAFTYDGNEKSVKLNVTTPSIVSKLAYSGNTGVDTGNYRATVASNDPNYVVKGASACAWEINPVVINLLSLTWSGNNFEYTGSEIEITLTNVPDYMTVTYDGNTATEAGTYSATFEYELKNSNYIAVGNPTPYTWTIVDPKAGLINVIEVKNGDTVLARIEAGYGIDATHQLLFSKTTSKYEDTDFSALGDDYKLSEAYDISFLDAIGNHVDENDFFTVKIRISDDIKTRDVKLVYISVDGKLVEVEAELQGDYIVFNTNHFSTYAIVANESVNAWMIISWSLIALLAIFIIVLVILYIVKSRSKKNVAGK